MDTFIRNDRQHARRVMLGIPTTGQVRYEWAAAKWGQVIPVNWSQGEQAVGFNDSLTPIGFQVHDARNICVEHCLKQDFEWLLFIDHDVILPPDFTQRMAVYMDEHRFPVVSGLYYTKGIPSDPLVFRGRGNGAYRDFTLGDRVWTDGIPMGMCLIHSSVLQAFTDEAETYNLPDGRPIRKVFWTPREVWQDPETRDWNTAIGTEDLWWCDEVIKRDLLRKAGWDEVADKRYPFLVDTALFGKHIDLKTGIQYP